MVFGFRVKLYFMLSITVASIFAVRVEGQVKAPFLLRYQTSVKGNMTLIGNNAVSETPTGNYNGTAGNHNMNMVFVDVDSDTSTFNSGNATLVLPAGLVCPVMKKVFLYWSAANMEDPGNEPAWNFDQVKLRLPGDSLYTTVTADQVIYNGRAEHFYNDPYTCVKDITGMVAADPQGTYWVANVKAKTGSLIGHGGGNTGCSGGWIIVVIYESASQPQKNISIFDGYVHVATEMIPNPLPFNFSGFQTVPTGSVNIDFLFGSLEGDWDLTGDYCEIQKTDGSWLTMSSALRQTNNFFHSIIGLDGAQFLNRVPASQNTLGFDADKFPIPNAGNTVIGNNQTSASIRVGTNQEIYGMFLIGLVVDVWFPDILTLFTIPAMAGGTGGSVNAGDTLTFSLITQNNGNDAAANLVLSTMLPPGLDFMQPVSPLPPGVVAGYNAATKLLSFTIPDSLAEVGDPPFTIQYKARAITDCVLLHDSLYSHGSCQVTASYHGVVNTTPQLNLSSTGLSGCGTGNLAPATFTIPPPPAIPAAINDSATTPEDTQVAVHVLANDTDCDHNINSGSLTIVAGPRHGQASVFHNSGYIFYHPDLNFYGRDTLQYRICDFDNQCDSALVFITVLPVNDPPRVRNETVTLCGNGSVSGNILANDADTVEHTAMTVNLPPLSGPAHGTVVVMSNGEFHYTPFPGYAGEDEIILQVCDSGYPLPALCLPDTLFISVLSVTAANAGSDLQFCDATVVTLSGNPPLQGTAEWRLLSGPDSVIITPAGSSGAVAGGLIPGTYLFIYSITNGYCNSGDTMMVTNLPPLSPAIAGADQVLCTATKDTISAALSSVPPLNGTGSWRQVRGPSQALIVQPGDPNTRVSNLISGVYQFNWTIAGSPCKPVTDSMLVTVSQGASVDAGADLTTCGRQPVTIAGSAASGFSAVSWITSGNGVFDDPHLLHPLYTPGTGDTLAGTITLRLTATATGSCPSVTDSLLITLSKPPSADAGIGGATCATIPFSFPGGSVSRAGSFSWSHNGQGQLTGKGTLTPVYLPAPGEKGIITFTLQAMGRDGCAASMASDTLQLVVYQPVEADAGPGQTIAAGTTALLPGSALQGSGSYRYQWEPALLVEDHLVNTAVTLPLNQDATFIFTVMDLLSGCSSSDSIHIAIKSVPNPADEPCPLIIHNVITPNNDGVNDTWFIDCIESYPLNKVLIFDRWGDKINETENYNNTSRVWNGTNQQGRIVPDGTYYYLVSVTNGKTYSGWVLVRGGNK